MHVQKSQKIGTPRRLWGALSGWGGRTLCNVALPEGGEESGAKRRRSWGGRCLRPCPDSEYYSMKLTICN